MAMSTETRPLNEDSLSGFLYALTAYLLWGLMPLYMKQMAHISPVEVIAHRVIWSLPIALAVLLIRRRTADLLIAFRTPKTLLMGAVTATLVSVNWGIYVWAIVSGQALEAALGYFINPLFSVFLGRVLLGERMNKMQAVAIALATIAVVVLTLDTGKLPLVGLGLTITWGFYAYLKKSLPIGPNQGFTLEVALLTPLALAYIGYLTATGNSHFLQGVPTDTALLIGCGAVTAGPLLIYANGAKGLRLTTIAMMGYIAPTMVFLTAVFIFKEPFGGAQAIAFPVIWAALALFTVSGLRRRPVTAQKP